MLELLMMREKSEQIAFNEFLLHGVTYALPQQSDALVRGMLTAHSAEPLNNIIQATDKYV